jgi:hypothetical protein
MLAFCVIFIIVWSILNFTFENLNDAHRAMISGGLAGLLAPRIKENKTQSGSQMQLKWIFFKKLISI